jgi:NADH-quinone oxidoreductase subunit C
VSPEELGDRLVGLAGPGASASLAFGAVTVDVPRSRWVEVATAARDDPALGLSFFDWLSAVDEQDAGFDVVVHLHSVEHRHHALLRTRVPRDEARLPSLVGVFAGAGWHERETHEMFGLGFDGHPNLVPLLLPDGFAGHPLRKDFVLASRVAKEWPGAKEPGESHTGATRRRMRPPGVPDDWGPAAEAAPAGAARAERPARRERPARPTRAARAAETAGDEARPVPPPTDARDTPGVEGGGG